MAILSIVTVLALVALLVLQLLPYIPAVGEWVKELPVYQTLFGWVTKLPVAMQFGVPFLFSLVLGIGFWLQLAWEWNNNVWSQDAAGNQFEHRNFEQKDIKYSKGAKTFASDFPCLIKKYLFWGYGFILVLSHDGGRVYKRIGPVYHAANKEAILTSRFASTSTIRPEDEVEAAEADEGDPAEDLGEEI